MKMLLSFMGGMVVCSLFFFSARLVIPTQAISDSPDGLSENNSLGLVDLIPDIERIYEQSLLFPFEKAESKIYDEDIAEYYRELLTRAGLRAETDEAP
jgi:hypothetical protein